MAKYHPDTRFLTDFAAGSLPESQALCVSAHLHYCASCRSKLNELSNLGAELFTHLEPVETADDAFSTLMDKIETGKEIKTETIAFESVEKLPPAINKITRGNPNNLNWRHIGKSFKYSTVNTCDNNRETSLFHIKAGGNVPKHTHRSDEITVVLKGSFSDQEDRYHVGDFIVRTKGEAHTPVASQDEDCLCLSTLDEPIIMNNWFYRLLMPLFNRPTSA